MNSQTQNGIPEPLPGKEQGKPLFDLLVQLDQSQWFEPKELAEAQLQQLGKLLVYAKAHSPLYAERLDGVDLENLSLEKFQEIPLLTRTDLQENNDRIDCSKLPKEHGAVSETMTSGSTGSPVRVRNTALSNTVWNAINLREQLWHGREFERASASIRWHGDKIGMPPDGIEFEDWGIPTNLFHETGPSYFLNSSSAIADQIDWLRKIQPGYLITHPSNLRGLIYHLRRSGSTLQGLLQVRTVGESVPDELRADVADLFGARIIDLYSCEELGYLGLQCPVQNHFHVQAESIHLEVLRKDGTPCAFDEPGKIVVTSLRNFATPLIRYEIGDFGELGRPCSCGRGLPVLKTVHGRVRNMLVHPDGSMHWPSFGFRKMMEIAPLKQFQGVQHALDEIELRLVVDEALSEEQEEGIRKILIENLGYPFEVKIVYYPELQRSASGKFEDFVSMLS